MEEQKQAVAVIGIGRVGLPLALFLAEQGHTVYGIDVNESYTRFLREERRMPFEEEGAQALLERHVEHSFFPTTDLSLVANARVIIITIGTPIDEHMNPVLAPVEAVVQNMLPHLRPGHLIVLRSTLSPGTTGFLQDAIVRKSKLEIGRDLFLAFCPERIAQGYSLTELLEIPQIVGGVDEASTEKAAAFFSGLGIQVHRTDAVSAELAKLFCNMYRYIDFAIANEFMMIASEYQRNIYEIVRVINTGYKRGGIKRPGLTGGPCLYKDGFFLIERTPYPELISNAWKINESVPGYLVSRLEVERDLKGARVGVMGLAFKRNNDDSRNSLSFKFIKIFKRLGCEVTAHDPYIKAETLSEALDSDVLVFATNHDAYSDWGREGLKTRVRPDTLICDPWNIFGTDRITFRASAL